MKNESFGYRRSSFMQTRLSRRTWLAAAGAVAGTAALETIPARARQATPVATPVASSRDWRSERWVGTWTTAVHPPAPGNEEFPSQLFDFDDQTVRQIVRVSAGGEQVRVRLANTYGEEPLLIGGAHVALRDGEARIDPASDRALSFSGNPTIAIPPGAIVLSDPVALSVPPLAELAVSLYLPEPTESTTVHGFAFQTNFISPDGDFTAETDMPVDATMQSWVFLSGVDVAVTEPTGVVVALGDSITDGAFSTSDTNRRWPDVLAERFAAADGPRMAVLNAGIGGNRLLGDEAGDFGLAFGQNALARFDRDVLAQPGVTHLIVFEGINDIGLPLLFGETDQSVTADEMIAALGQLAERAHERGIVAFGATITPFEGAFYFSPEGEAIRQTVNAWIRDGGAFDAVIDFDAVVRDPDRPASLLPAYDGGDHLHINDAGFRAMAESIDLGVVRDAG